MVFPVTIIGHPVLRKVAKDIDQNQAGLTEFIDDMFETMYSADGVGLAAPQVGKSWRLFVIDATPMKEDAPELEDFKRVFINPKITERTGEEVLFEEGCLSIPGLREEIKRKSDIQIQYYDENFEFHDETFQGVKSRIVQHEYDHLDGILFVDKVSPLRKRLIKARLTAISKGKFDASYKYKLGRR